MTDDMEISEFLKAANGELKDLDALDFNIVRFEFGLATDKETNEQYIAMGIAGVHFNHACFTTHVFSTPGEVKHMIAALQDTLKLIETKE